jgi:hypothetical protein
MIRRILRASVIGAGCAAIGLAIHCSLRKSFMPYVDYAYQEYSTRNPAEGFESVEGYTGSQTFFWNEILTSRDFNLTLLKERGETPKTRWGNLPVLSARDYDDFAANKKEGLYVRMSLGQNTVPAENYRVSIVHDFAAISKVFVDAARQRGVTIAPVGDVALYTADTGWRAALRSSWRPYLLLCCGSAVAVALLGYRKENSTK